MKNADKTHCPQGHEYSPENTIFKGHSRNCKSCISIRKKNKTTSWLPAEERLWAKTDKTPGHGPNGDCWLWTGSHRSTGYGQLSIKDKPVHVHRLSWILANGPIPAGLLIMHSCDTPLCVNPAHLSPGTHQENVDDMRKKGRAACQQVTHCPRGHEYSTENTRMNNGGRVCRKCNAIRTSRKAQRLRAAGVRFTIEDLI
jgi:CxxC motif-containing protein